VIIRAAGGLWVRTDEHLPWVSMLNAALLPAGPLAPGHGCSCAAAPHTGPHQAPQSYVTFFYLHSTVVAARQKHMCVHVCVCARACVCVWLLWKKGKKMRETNRRRRREQKSKPRTPSWVCMICKSAQSFLAH